MFKLITKWWKSLSRSVQACFIVFAFTVLPHLVITLFGTQESVGRAIAVGFAYCSGFIVFLWWGLSPNSKIIMLRGKLNRPEYAATRPLVEKGFRLVIIIFGGMIGASLIVPFSEDIIEAAQGEQSIQFTGKAAVESGPYHIWFLIESFDIAGDKNRATNLHLLYPKHAIENGKLYYVTFLPRSCVVLQARPVSE